MSPNVPRPGANPSARRGFAVWAELVVVLALFALAAITRLPGLAERGRWDADQGHDMLVLRGLVVEGDIPLLGPLTSIGTFHHGAVYYDLLAPAALLSGADPVAVTGEVALFGIAAVLATWWLARLIGGPLAGAAAGLLATISPAGIDESTFIWNPNLIPLAAALAFAGALRARQTGRSRWWLLAGLGAMITMQCHVLGVVIVPPLVALWVIELLRRRAAGSEDAGSETAGLVRAGAGALAIIAAGYVPLAVHELLHDFSETRAVIDYLAGGGRGAAAGLVDRVVLVGLRSVTWPLVGLISDRPSLSSIAAVVAAVLAGVAALAGRAPDRAAARWLLVTLGWSVIALAMFAPNLATITPGLPNDHYHAFLDPIVLALSGVGLARLAGGSWALPGRRWALPGRPQPLPGGDGGGPLPRLDGRAIAGVLLAGLVVVGVTAWPPGVAEDGGWRLVEAAAARVAATARGASVSLDGIPPFKSADALRFPLVRLGVAVAPAPADAGASSGGTAGAISATIAVLVCDPLFDAVVGAPCGGPAEDVWLAAPGRPALVLVERFTAGPRRVISVYAAGP